MLRKLFRTCVPVVAAVAAACGSSSTTTPTTPTTPTIPTGQTQLATGSIAASGGTLTVNKAGDPLNGLTLTLDAGAFPSALNATITSSSNASLPTANGIVPIAPVVHVFSSAAGYAAAPITIRIPAKVPANTFPVVVMYDSATRALEPLTTIAFDSGSVTAMTRHLNKANMLPIGASASAVSQAPRASFDVTGGTGQLTVDYGIFAIPAAILDADHDTKFRPGTHDWEIRSTLATEPSRNGQSLGAVVTETWYYNTRASTTPLNGRFTPVAGKALTDRTGFRWSAATDNAVSNDYNSYLSGAYKRLEGITGQATPAQQATLDTRQYKNVEAAFALAALNGTAPVPVLIDLQATGGYFYVVAYRTTGSTLFVADPASPGDQTRSITFSDGTPASYAATGVATGQTFGSPIMTSLGLALPLAPIAASYQQVLAGTIGNDIFPATNFRSPNGLLYDTVYVVDSLRLWAECPTCKYGFATTITPTPTANVEFGAQIYQLSGSTATDSLGSLGPNGIKATASATGTDRVFGFPLYSATSAGQSSGSGNIFWLDYRQLTIRTLLTSITLPATAPSLNNPFGVSMKVDATLLPKSVTYQWDFGDGTTKVSVANAVATTHTYTKTGTYTIKCEIVDDRNAQVIARSTTSVTAGTVAINFTVAGTWAPGTMAPNGTYTYGDLIPYATGQSPAQGIGGYYWTYDHSPKDVNSYGVGFEVLGPTTTPFAVGQTYNLQNAAQGTNTFVMLISTTQDPNNLVSPLSVAGTGTLTLTAVTPQTDGSIKLGYTFSISNGGTGTVTGTGIGQTSTQR